MTKPSSHDFGWWVLTAAVIGLIVMGLLYLDERDEASSCEGAQDAYASIEDGTSNVPRYEVYSAAEDTFGLNYEKLDGWLAGHNAALFDAELVVIEHCGDSPPSD